MSPQQVFCSVVLLWVAHLNTYHALPQKSATPEPVVSVVQGSMMGSVSTSRKGREYFQFRRIPFAETPVGDLRFKAPQPKKSWSGILNAKNDGPVCIQKNYFLPGKPVQGLEDCLYLNVYTPKLPRNNSKSDLMDVIFTSASVAFAAGSGISLILDPDYLMDKDIVVVTTNYRLGPLGFLSTEDAVAPGNFGLKDQVAALRWVKTNIAKFGGNPNSVTVHGGSSGSACIHYMLMSPMTKGLFKRAITQSGTSLSHWSIARKAKRQSERLAEELGCPTKTSQELINCLKKKDASDIVEITDKLLEWHVHPLILYRPVVENFPVKDGEEKFLVEEPLKLLKSGQFQKVPIIMGTTAQDGSSMYCTLKKEENALQELTQQFGKFAPLALDYKDATDDIDGITARVKKFYFGDKPLNASQETLIDMFTDRVFILGADRTAKLLARSSNQPIYSYQFAYRGKYSFTEIVTDEDTDYGVGHGDDSLYVYRSPIFFPDFDEAGPEQKMIDIMTTMWANFARTGNPTPANSKDGLSFSWSPLTKDNLQYLHINLDPKMKRDLAQDRVAFWESLPLKESGKTLLFSKN